MKAKKIMGILLGLMLTFSAAAFAACDNGPDESGPGFPSSGSDVPASGSTDSSGSGSDTTDPSKEELDVVLFTGQSNMVGRETSAYAVDIPAGYAYEYLYAADELSPLKNPVGEGMTQAEKSSGSSIVPQFCADYVEATGRKVVAVHVARGGQQIAAFMQGKALYNDIVTKYSACLEYIEGSEEYTVGRTFYVMYQGESDSLNSADRVTTSKEQYISNYMNFHDGLQSQFDFEFGALIYTGRSIYESLDGVKTINGAQRQLAENEDDIIVCDKEPAIYYLFHPEYMRSDNVHLNAAGLQKVGSDACAAVLDYMGLGDEAKAGIDPVTYLEEPVYELQAEAADYEWNFDKGDMREANGKRTVEKIGTGSATFTDGRYAHASGEAVVYYALSEPISLPASGDWSMEWKGRADRGMNGHASVLLTNGANVFITFQETNGIYVRNNDAKAQFKNFDLDEMYVDHVWKLEYSAAAKAVELFIDGESQGALAWSADLQFTHLFGATDTYSSADNNYSFVGSVDYLKISVG